MIIFSSLSMLTLIHILFILDPLFPLQMSYTGKRYLNHSFKRLDATKNVSTLVTFQEAVVLLILILFVLGVKRLYLFMMPKNALLINPVALTVKETNY